MWRQMSRRPDCEYVLGKPRSARLCKTARANSLALYKCLGNHLVSWPKAEEGSTLCMDHATRYLTQQPRPETLFGFSCVGY